MIAQTINASDRPREASDPHDVSRILIASEGRGFSDEVIECAALMLRANAAEATVLSVARLWGTVFGLPNPGLRPSRRELEEQRENVFSAIDRLNAAGIKADGHIVITRNPCKCILNAVKSKGIGAIVMGADRRRPWFMRNFMWSQEPYRVEKRMRIPVYLVCSVAPEDSKQSGGDAVGPQNPQGSPDPA